MIRYTIFIFFSCILSAQTAQELFLQANQSYTQKEYEKALDLYDKISPKGAAVWYNMGNCAYKKGDSLYALLYWQHAQENGIGSIASDSKYNSELILRTIYPDITFQSPFVKQIPPLLLQILFFCICSIFLVASRYLLQRKKIIMLMANCMILASVGVLTYTAYTDALYKKALIMHNESAFYAGPDTEYHQLAAVPAGSLVRILDTKNTWAKIAWGKQIGWIADKELAVIN